MIIKTIASSSKGNCYTVNDGETTIMIECGIPIARIKKALNFKLSAISGCLVSHEHRDHCKAALPVMRAGIDLYASKGTIAGLDGDSHRLKRIEAGKVFSIGTFKIMPFETIHDAAEPLGFLIVSGSDKLLFATDTAYINNRFNGLTHIMIESNYHPDILEKNIESGAVSYSQKKRLLFSHMSLDNLLIFLKKNDLSKLREIFLLHLSNDNSDEKLMRLAVAGLTGVPVTICKQS